MPKQYNFILKDINDTKLLANKLGKHITAKEILAISGEIGAGKTSLAKFIIQYITKNSQATVKSPTFNLLYTYDSKNFKIWHYDLYRIKHQEELFELGIDEAITNHFTIIEWPEIVKSLLPKNQTLFCHITIQKQNQRHIAIQCQQDWKYHLSNIIL